MKAFIARYICEYDDGLALSSEEIVRTDKNKLIDELSKDYGNGEIDIDTGKYEYGWEINEIEIV